MIVFGEVQPGEDLADDPPVDHVIRFEYRHAHVGEFRTYHVVLLVHPDDVRVGIVRVKNGIDIGAIALVAPGAGFGGAGRPIRGYGDNFADGNNLRGGKDRYQQKEQPMKGSTHRCDSLVINAWKVSHSNDIYGYIFVLNLQA